MRRAVRLFVVLVACGGQDVKGADSGADATTDVAADVAVDAPVDGPGDADAVDAPANAPLEAAADDATPETGADGGATGTVLWLDAAKGVTTNGALVVTWADQSGHKNDGAGVFSQPTLVASAINGLPAVRFSATAGTRIVVGDSPSLEWGTGDYLVAVVARFDNAPTATSSAVGVFYQKLNGGGSAVSFSGNQFDLNTLVPSAGLQMLEDTKNDLTSSTAWGDGVARLYVARRAGQTLEIRVNGSPIASVAENGSVDVSNPGADVGIGSYATNSGENLDGDVAELVAVAGPMSAADLATLEGGLVSKYAL